MVVIFYLVKMINNVTLFSYACPANFPFYSPCNGHGVCVLNRVCKCEADFSILVIDIYANPGSLPIILIFSCLYILKLVR